MFLKQKWCLLFDRSVSGLCLTIIQLAVGFWKELVIAGISLLFRRTIKDPDTVHLGIQNTEECDISLAGDHS